MYCLKRVRKNGVWYMDSKYHTPFFTFWKFKKARENSKDAENLLSLLMKHSVHLRRSGICLWIDLQSTKTLRVKYWRSLNLVKRQWKLHGYKEKITRSSPKSDNKKEGINSSWLHVINGDADFRWSSGPHSAWGSKESTAILTTHPSLKYN